MARSLNITTAQKELVNRRRHCRNSSKSLPNKSIRPFNLHSDDVSENPLEWCTDSVIQWLNRINQNLSKEYTNRLKQFSISGQHFNRSQLGNVQWCRFNLGMKHEDATALVHAVRFRLTQFQNHRKVTVFNNMEIELSQAHSERAKSAVDARIGNNHHQSKSTNINTNNNNVSDNHIPGPPMMSRSAPNSPRFQIQIPSPPPLPSPHQIPSPPQSMSPQLQPDVKSPNSPILPRFHSPGILYQLQEERDLVEMLQTENANLKKQINEILDASQSAQMIQRLKSDKMSLEFALSAMTQQRDDIFNALKEVNIKSKVQKGALIEQMQMDDILEENRNLKVQNEHILKENKVMESEIERLKLEIVSMTKCNLDRSQWRDWTPHQVFQFIMSTVEDGSLDAYRCSIEAEILESEYDGDALVDITLDHVKAMGIKKIHLRNAVLKSVKDLVNEVHTRMDSVSVVSVDSHNDQVTRGRDDAVYGMEQVEESSHGHHSNAENFNHSQTVFI